MGSEIPPNGYADVVVTFDKAFSGVPQVLVSMSHSTTSQNYGYVIFTVVSRSSTSCTIRIINASTSDGMAPYAAWIAIYQP